VSAYEYALEVTLAQEGRLSEHPDDPGDRTWRGLTQRRYDEYRQSKSSPLQDVTLVFDAEFAEIYRTYWDAIDGDNLPPGLAVVAFDIAVNSGAGKANAFLQEGFKTAGGLTARRLLYYADLSIWSTFGKGWTRRAARVLQAAESLS